jgi:hypothetical protein
MQPKRTSKEPIPSSSCQRGSSSSVHLALLLVFMFLLVYPLAATPLFPHVSLFRRKACLSVHHRNFPLVDAVVGCRCVHAIYYSHHRVSPDLSAMASPTLAGDPSDTACRQKKSNLWVVWRGSQRVNYVYVML